MTLLFGEQFGALLLVSDTPMVPEGAKTIKSDNLVNLRYAEKHVKIGIESLQTIMNVSNTLKHLKTDW